MGTKRTFTEGKIFSPLISFAFPVLIALFLQAMYGAVDLWVVGKFGSAADVSAVATGGQVTYTVTAVIVGLSMGIIVLIGQKIGEGREREAGQVIGSGICMFLLVFVALTAAMLLAAEPLAHLMQAPEATFSQTVDYLRICFAGTAFIVAYNVLGSVFRGIGDSKMPLIAVAIACVFNIIGDLIFVAVFHMGTRGAALATVMAQAFSVLLSIFIIRRRMLPVSLCKKDLRPEKKAYSKNFVSGSTDSLSGPDGQYFFSDYYGNCQFHGSNRFGWSGRGGKALCIHYAGSLSLYAVYGCVCGPECRRKKTGSGRKGVIVWHLVLACGRLVYGVSFFFSWKRFVHAVCEGK